MNHFFATLSLACAAMLLSGCPDTKLPDPNPMVPKPKAQAMAHPWQLSGAKENA